MDPTIELGAGAAVLLALIRFGLQPLIGLWSDHRVAALEAKHAAELLARAEALEQAALALLEAENNAAEVHRYLLTVRDRASVGLRERIEATQTTIVRARISLEEHS